MVSRLLNPLSQSVKPISEEPERRREQVELTSALRNFAKHFGAAEVYQHARAIYLESPAREQPMPLRAPEADDAGPETGRGIVALRGRQEGARGLNASRRRNVGPRTTRESLPLVRSFCLAVSERCEKVTSYA